MGKHAVVIGASMGGLLAARALADHYERVTVLERDTFPAMGEHRKGVPQGRHAHSLLSIGREVLEELFPGFSQEVVAQGGVKSLYASRPLLEGHVRQRVLALPNLRAIERCDVLGLTTDGQKERVTGVRLAQRESGVEQLLGAELMVDASALIDSPWSIVVGRDLRLKEVEGKRSATSHFVNWYLGKLPRAARHDPAVAMAFGKVVNFRDRPKSLLHPRVLWRVLRGNLFPPRAAAAEPRLQKA